MKAELDKVVGQAALKAELLRFEKGVALQQKRRELGLACAEAWPPHMLFRGNPGTGKTTIARLVGRALQALGTLKRGHLVEVQRADLVAGAIGQTALKTRAKVEEAKGGVLFVDEAYTLAPGSGMGGAGGSGGGDSKDFGREAINELMATMTDGDPVMIFAGYAAEMASFVAQNAGLFRRIDAYFDFADYSCVELAQILRYDVASSGFALEPGVTDAQLEALLRQHTTPAQRAAMNGGLAKQLFRKARARLDASLDLANVRESSVCTLKLEHLAAAAKHDLASPAPLQPASGKR